MNREERPGTLGERLDRWVDYCEATGRNLDYILVHPEDRAHAPDIYRGYRVIAIGERNILERAAA